MMPDLGRYALEVLTAYGASLGLLALLVGASLWRAARVRRALAERDRRRD
jgi:heme exporter protein D